MQRNKVYKVVAGLTMQSYAGQRKLAGIFKFLAGSYLWDISLLRSAGELTLDFIERTKRETDGYLISLHETADIRQALVKTGKPIVFLDEIDLGTISRTDNASFLQTNQAAIGSAAARHFLGQAQFATFGFVPAVGKPHWSVGRAEGFVRTLARRKRSVVFYESDVGTSDSEHLATWIKSLPKPAAIFAAFDDRAVDVINGCRSGGVKIPSDVMVLGAGDDELICNSSRPTISSVKIPFEDHGFLAARELQARMMMPNGRRKVISTANDYVITKRQTTAGKDNVSVLVQDGLAFISTYATSGIRVPDVIRHLNVSRRLADLRFRQSTGKSILRTIVEAKINAAKRLLRTTSLPIADIAGRCGFSNANYFKNVFVRTVGTSPRSWRNAHQPQKESPVFRTPASP